MKRGAPLRRTPLKSRRASPRRTALREEHGLPWPEVRALVHARSLGLCEVCGVQLTASLEAHHRLTRRYGPDCPCNVLALCGPCHHERVHGQPEEARDAGAIISRHYIGPPSEVPVWVFREGPVLLDCAGAYRPLEH